MTYIKQKETLKDINALASSKHTLYSSKISSELSYIDDKGISPKGVVYPYYNQDAGRNILTNGALNDLHTPRDHVDKSIGIYWLHYRGYSRLYEKGIANMDSYDQGTSVNDGYYDLNADFSFEYSKTWITEAGGSTFFRQTLLLPLFEPLKTGQKVTTQVEYISNFDGTTGLVPFTVTASFMNKDVDRYGIQNNARDLMAIVNQINQTQINTTDGYMKAINTVEVPFDNIGIIALTIEYDNTKTALQSAGRTGLKIYIRKAKAEYGETSTEWTQSKPHIANDGFAGILYEDVDFNNSDTVVSSILNSGMILESRLTVQPTQDVKDNLPNIKFR